MSKAGNAPQNMPERHAGKHPPRNASATYNKGGEYFPERKALPTLFFCSRSATAAN